MTNQPQSNPDGLIDVTPLRPRCLACKQPLTPVGKYFECLNDSGDKPRPVFTPNGTVVAVGEPSFCRRYQILVTGGLPPLTVVSEKP